MQKIYMAHQANTESYRFLQTDWKSRCLFEDNLYKTWNSSALIWSPADLDKKKGKAKTGSWKYLYLELKKQFTPSTMLKTNKYDYQYRGFYCLIVTTNANKLCKSRADDFNSSLHVNFPSIKGEGRRIRASIKFPFTLSPNSLWFFFSPKSELF